MEYIKLVRLMYVAECNSLNDIGAPMIYDFAICLGNGPVLTMTYNLIVEGNQPGENEFWSNYITLPRNGKVILRRSTGNDQISAAEMQIIEEVYSTFGGFRPWILVKFLRDSFLETAKDGFRPIPISYGDILKNSLRSDDEIARVEARIKAKVVMNLA